MPRPYDQHEHHRRSIRLREYDYAGAGAYFVTIVTYEHAWLFDDVVLRRVAETNWHAIQRHFANVTLDEWVVMPNHLHGVIVIEGDARRGEAFPGRSAVIEQIEGTERNRQFNQLVGNASPLQPRGVTPGSLGAIIGNFKSVTTRRINAIRHMTGASIWQRNYYEHIVRDERDFNRIQEYIAMNPARWELDRENPRRGMGQDDWSADEDRWFGHA